MREKGRWKLLGATVAALVAALSAVEAAAQENPKDSITQSTEVEESPPEAEKTGSAEQEPTLSPGDLGAEMARLEDREARLEAEVEGLKRREAERTAREEKERRAAKARRAHGQKLGELLPIEFFAFGDFYFAFEEDGGRWSPEFAVGQLEVDVQQTLADFLVISAAFAYDGETNHFGLGAFTIDGLIAGRGPEHPFQTDTIETSGVIFGLFDVPFGIDYLKYASIDRRLWDVPLAVSASHDAWNDMGGQLYLDAGWMNAVLFVVNGFGYTYEDEQGQEQVSATELASGGRIGFSPAGGLEVGGSAALFFDSDANVEQILAGGDVQVAYEGLSLEGEYIFHQTASNLANSKDLHGFYGTAMYDFDPLYVAGRYAQTFSDELESGKELTAGFGFKVLETAEVRFIYNTGLKDGNHLFLVQLAGGSAWQPTGLRR